MLYNLLTDATRRVGVGEVSLYALLGFGIVFIGIAFLILVVWAVGKIITKTSLPKKAEEKPLLAAPNEDEEITDELVAVITAAITAYYQQNNPKCEFTVKRIKRI